MNGYIAYFWYGLVMPELNNLLVRGLLQVSPVSTYFAYTKTKLTKVSFTNKHYHQQLHNQIQIGLKLNPKV